MGYIPEHRREEFEEETRKNREQWEKLFGNNQDKYKEDEDKE